MPSHGADVWHRRHRVLLTVLWLHAVDLTIFASLRGYEPLHALEHGVPLVPGRIVAIADVFDAMTHDRPYKRAVPLEMAIDEIRSLRGRQFDPRVVDAFEALPHEDLLDLRRLRATAA